MICFGDEKVMRDAAKAQLIEDWQRRTRFAQGAETLYLPSVPGCHYKDKVIVQK